MIEIRILKNRINVKGHSGLSEEGSDIVCAAVSILWYAITEKFHKEEMNFELREEPGQSEMVLNEKSKKKLKLAKHIIDTAICGLEALCEEYPENLSLKKY